MATNDIGTMAATLSVQGKAWEQGIAKSQKEFQTFVGVLGQFGSGDVGGGLVAGISVASGPLGALAAAGIGVASSLKGMLDKTVESIDKLDDMARKLGIAADALRGLERGAVHADVEVSALHTGLTKFQQKLGEAIIGSTEARKTFEDLGLSWEKLSVMKGPDAFLAAIAKLSEKGQQEKIAGLIDLLGKSGAELSNLATDGAKGAQDFVDQMAKRKESLEKTIAAVRVADEALKSRKDAWEDSMLGAKFWARAGAGFDKAVTSFLRGGDIPAAMSAVSKIGEEEATELEKLAKAAEGADGIDAAAKAQERLANQIGMANQKLQEQIDLFGLSDTEKERRKLVGAGATDEQLAGFDVAAQEMEQKKIEKDFSAMADGLEAQVETFGQAASSADIYKLAVRGLNDEFVQYLQSLADQLDAKKKLEDATKKEQAEIEKLLKDSATPAQTFEKDIQRLNELVLAGTIQWDQYEAAVMRSWDAMAKAADLAKDSFQTPEAAAFGSKEATRAINEFERSQREGVNQKDPSAILAQIEATEKRNGQTLDEVLRVLRRKGIAVISAEG